VNEIAISSETNTSDPFPVIWDTWFNEKIVYSPTTGVLQYFVDGTNVTKYFIGVMPATNNPTIQFGFQAWGWFTGHEELFANFLVTQDFSHSINLQIHAPVSNAPPVLELNAPAGYNYLIDSSTNLLDWTPWALLVNTNGTVLFSDPSWANSKAQFYRANVP
jgi:hypothetical protein